MRKQFSFTLTLAVIAIIPATVFCFNSLNENHVNQCKSFLTPVQCLDLYKNHLVTRKADPAVVMDPRIGTSKFVNRSSSEKKQSTVQNHALMGKPGSRTPEVVYMGKVNTNRWL